MKNPIQPQGFWATPESMDALMFNQEQYSGGERTAFTMGMMLTWNYLSAQIDEWLKSQQGEFPVTVVWGTDACRQIGERDLDGLRDLGSVGTTVFPTKAEADTYWRGVEETEGWLEAVVYAGNEDAIPVPTNDHEI